MVKALNVKLTEYLFSDKRFYRAFIMLAVPIVIQNFMASALNLVDNLMIGMVGSNELSGVGQANQYFNILGFILYGLSGGVGIFAAQFWGVQNKKGIIRIVQIGLGFGGVISGLFLAAALVIPQSIIGLFTTDHIVIGFGSDYLFLVAFSYPATAVTFVLAAALRSCGQVKIPMYASVSALLLNSGLNYLFIFGNFGAPKLGVKGAAVATLIARLVEMGIICIYMLFAKNKLWGDNEKKQTEGKKHLFSQFFQISLPIIINEALWGAGNTMYAVVFGRISTDAFSAYTVAGTIEKMAWILILGIGSACAVIVGQELGAGNKQRAYRYSVRCGLLSVGFGILVSVVLILIAGPITSVYHFDASIIRTGKQLIYVLAGVFVFKSFNYTSICGYFRAGGDTKYCMFLDIGGIWLISVPLMLLFGWYLKAPVFLVYLFANFNEIVNSVINLVHLRRKRWMNNINTMKTHSE